jgi:hypothetical protein
MEYKDKLEVIANITKNREKLNNITSGDSDRLTQYNFTNLDKSTKKLIISYLNKFEQENKKENTNDINLYKNYLVNKRKLKAIGLYLHLVWAVMALRYIDMLVRVKHGGLFYYSGMAVSYYYLNTYLSNYKLLKLAEITRPGAELSSIIQAIRDNDSKVRREDYLTKQKLNKYWKEPMAWH